MKPPILHISGSNGQHRCGTNADDKNWPDRYLTDELARTNLRVKTMQNTEDYQGEDYNDEVMNQVIDITPTRERVKTLRMYLEVRV